MKCKWAKWAVAIAALARHAIPPPQTNEKFGAQLRFGGCPTGNW